MAECNNNCSTCNTSCKSGCPLCNVKGKTVPLITVKSLVKTGSNYLNDNQAYICINRKCNVIYFQEENPKYFIKEEVKELYDWATQYRGDDVELMKKVLLLYLHICYGEVLFE